MSKKRGLSADEKVQKTKEFLLEKREPFTLKELERLLPKAKGVVFQSVKECLAVLQVPLTLWCDWRLECFTLADSGQIFFFHAWAALGIVFLSYCCCLTDNFLHE
eukprot:RCo001745